ncbi:UDP-4-amino-4,6-dideoxy-N-acetyl-beta-L-altrosamine transaminase [Hahella ganghwensis]|uniref:UDP-4-amino-4, 6-dideoxy-N-acetyl-beta-L-altrosamine transaminase n=1 Tax=Hahella ganghwensis TaxID=286420 RepID=UPI00037E0491|nr:UDP-4-amino-4,6-dideoxy-N-acetyl-beta-L-altrosamine transaminase [Hahella ganghwensis]
MIPYGRQDLSEQDIEAVCRVLKSDYLTQGPEVPLFEQVLGNLVKARHVVAVNSGTSALHIACLALDVGPGDYVWTSPISFVASSNCALYCGASVDFVDVEPDTGNMSVAALKARLEDAEVSGKLPKVVIPVHFAGQPCDMKEISELASRYGFRVIEDASHGLGARYFDEPVGSCRWSDMTVFSFHPVKMITTGEGGAVSTNQPALAEKLSQLRSHGITRDDSQFKALKNDPWVYEQQSLGFNYRMTDLQAALGRSQSASLPGFVSRRQVLAAAYQKAFTDSDVQVLTQKAERSSSWHIFVIQVPEDCRRAMFDLLRESGIGVNVHYIPIYLQPFYQQLGFRSGYCPQAELFYQQALTIPLYTSLSEGELQQVADSVIQALETTSSSINSA